MRWHGVKGIVRGQKKKAAYTKIVNDWPDIKWSVMNGV